MLRAVRDEDTNAQVLSLCRRLCCSWRAGAGAGAALQCPVVAAVTRFLRVSCVRALLPRAARSRKPARVSDGDVWGLCARKVKAGRGQPLPWLLPPLTLRQRLQVCAGEAWLRPDPKTQREKKAAAWLVAGALRVTIRSGHRRRLARDQRTEQQPRPHRPGVFPDQSHHGDGKRCGTWQPRSETAQRVGVTAALR